MAEQHAVSTTLLLTPLARESDAVAQALMNDSDTHVLAAREENGTGGASHTRLLEGVITRALDGTLRDGVPSVVLAFGSPASPAHWFQALIRVLQLHQEATGLVEVGHFRASTTDPTVQSATGEKAVMQPIAGLGPFPILRSVPYDAVSQYEAATSALQSAIVAPTLEEITVFDMLVHRHPEVGPTRFIVAYASALDVVERLVTAQRQVPRPAGSASRLVGEAFGGGWRGHVGAFAATSDEAVRCVGLLQACRNVLSTPRRRSVNPSFRVLLDATLRELGALNPSADRAPLEAKAAFLRSRSGDGVAAAATNQPEPAAAASNAEVAPSQPSERGAASARVSPSRSRSVDEQLAKVIAERDAAQWIAAEANSRAARFEAAHAELLEEHRQVCKHHSRVEERLHSEIASQIARIRALEAELSAAVAAQRTTRRQPSPVVARPEPQRSHTPTSSGVTKTSTVQSDTHPAGGAAQPRATSPGPTTSKTGVPPLAKVPSRSAASPSVSQSATTSKQPSPRMTPRIGTPLTRSPTRTESDGQARASSRQSSTSRRMESPREVRQLLVSATFTQPTTSSSARARSQEPPVPAAVTRMQTLTEQNQNHAVPVVAVGRPRLVTPVRSSQPFRSENFQTTYRPTRLVRHAAWESVDDAVQRDNELRAIAHPARPVLGSAPPQTNRSQYAASSVRS